jgi:ATP-dependent Lhr-like helicase
MLIDDAAPSGFILHGKFSNINFVLMQLMKLIQAEPETLSERLHPLIANWFLAKFQKFTHAQRLCIPAIVEKRSVLLSSPTGSGKTLAAFLGINDFILRRVEKPERNAVSGVQAIYISPLRALAYDIQKNLAGPIEELGLKTKIRVALRTGESNIARSGMSTIVLIGLEG